MRQIELRHLRYFVAVAQAGSVMAGARAAGIVQPALSRQIRELEDAIGTPLLIRRTTGVTLTAAGASFLQDATGLL
ncbi:MAG: LysR family transcriptional regulator, partial [Burkholderia sp.]|nr:LysR family transcriptional regulator [Burkholderia sp.]